MIGPVEFNINDCILHGVKGKYHMDKMATKTNTCNQLYTPQLCQCYWLAMFVLAAIFVDMVFTLNLLTAMMCSCSITSWPYGGHTGNPLGYARLDPRGCNVKWLDWILNQFWHGLYLWNMHVILHVSHKINIYL